MAKNHTEKESNWFVDKGLQLLIQVVLGVLPFIVTQLSLVYILPDLLWAVAIVIIVVFFGVGLWKFAAYFGETERNLRIFLFIAFYAITLLAVWNELVGPILSSYLIDTDPNVLLQGKAWVVYEPTEYNPATNLNPTVDSMDKELEWVSNAGFSGIITLSSQGSLSEIPKLAKKHNLLVIAGVWDPTNRQEVASAILNKDYIDAYSVGHNGVNWLYSFSDLTKTIRKIRFHTRHPVSTTEIVSYYLVEKRLFGIGDWVFPDAHVSVKDEGGKYSVNAVRDKELTIELAKIIASQKERNGKTILLKMVMYPMSGAPNASLDEQAHFFDALLANTQDVQPEIPIGVVISAHSAYDISWKTYWPFYKWETSTGLLDKSGNLRPAARSFLRR
ncbi:MAG: hypothetical protein Q8L87_20525 [Anaerolineales bacterium]|jgi:exo-beta-1,3-glucanase (GH17 family)|nr:hypothetical protein [Anaerolineales bacterium]